MYTNHPDGHQCISHCPISCPQGAHTHALCPKRRSYALFPFTRPVAHLQPSIVWRPPPPTQPTLPPIAQHIACPPTCNSGEVLQSMGEHPLDCVQCPLADVCISEAQATCPPCPPVEYEVEPGSLHFMSSGNCSRRLGEPCTCATPQHPVPWDGDHWLGVDQAMVSNLTYSPTCPCPPGDIMPCSTGIDWIELPPSEDGEGRCLS